MKGIIFLSLISLLWSGLVASANSNVEIPPSPYTDVKVSKVEATTIAQFEAPYFLECAHSRNDGSVLVTSHLDGRLYRLQTDSRDIIADVDGKLTCLTPLDNDRYLITGWNAQDEAVLYVISLEGKVEEIPVPEGQFLNGIVALDNDRFLVADSYKGVIWQYSHHSGEIKVWLDDPLLKRQNPEQTFPGINGLQRQGEMLYFSNNAKMFMGRIALNANNQPGVAEIYHPSILIDDFVVDHQHRIIGATHIYDSVILITPAREVVIIADPMEGVTGSTSVSWTADKTSLYVTTNGGLLTLTAEGAEPARLVKLALPK